MSEIRIFDIQRFSLHDGPGIRTTVFFKGCGMFCPWCANPESQSGKKQLMHFDDKCVRCGRCAAVCPEKAVGFCGGRVVFDRDRCTCCGICARECPRDAIVLSGRAEDTEDILRILLKDRDYYENSGGGVTFSGGEPLLQPEGLLELSSMVKNAGVRTALDTAGSVPAAVFDQAVSGIDLILMDFKSADREKLRRVTGGDLALIAGNMERAVRAGKEVIARIPAIPSFNLNDGDMGDIFGSLRQIGVKRADLLPYHLLGRKKYERLGMAYPFSGQDKALEKAALTKYIKLGNAFGIETAV